MNKLLIITLCLLSRLCIAQEVTIGISPNLPPYIITKQHGIELDLIKSALATQNIAVKFEFFRYSLLRKAIKKEHIDGVILNGVHTDVNTFQSDQLLAFKNFAIAFKKHQFSINEFDDLAGKRVVSFKGATQVLGQQYTDATKKMAAYIEHTNQMTQVKLFLGGRYNIVISDQRIFKYWSQQEQKLGKLALSNGLADIEYFPIFEQSPRKMNCKMRDICDALSNGLKVIITNGQYTDIMARYL